MNNFFSNLFNSSKKKLQQELANEVNEFILDEDSTNIALFIENGYKLSFDEALKITMFAQGQKGYERPIYSSICHIYDTKVKTELIAKFKKINKIMASGSSRVNKEDSVMSLFRNFSYFDTYFSFCKYSKDPLFKDNQFCVEALVIMKSIHRHIVKEVGPKYKKESLMDRKAKNNLEDIRNQIEGIINYIESNKKKIIQESIQQKIEKFNPVLQDFVTLKEEMALDIITNIKNFDEASFPSKAAEIIADIKQLYRSIRESHRPKERCFGIRKFYTFFF